MTSNEIYDQIEHWQEEDLLELPTSETDYYEYKSSKMSFDNLKEEIPVAASAFWNSGGGILFSGINDNGEIDGGIPKVKGRQKLRDWVDQMLSKVEPVGPYSIKLIEKESTESRIADDKVVLIIAFGQSYSAPHMAPDKKYYIRAGVHSEPASHFLVEAIRLRRTLEKPMLRGILRTHPLNSRIIQLGVVTVNSATALNVTLNFEPLPLAFEQHFEVYGENFPLIIPVIDKQNPFYMDLYSQVVAQQMFGNVPVEMKLSYEDLAGRTFQETQTINPKKNKGPMYISSDNKIEKSLENITKQLINLNQVIQDALKKYINDDE